MLWRIFFASILWSVALLLPVRAVAIEIYSLYPQGCEPTIGAIVGVDEDRAVILDLAGRLRSLPTEKISLVARYDVLENPFRQIGGSGGDGALLEITSQSSRVRFLAYATNFFDGLVLFLDDQGKIRVVEFDDIVTIRRPHRGKDKGKANRKRLAAKDIELLPPPGREQCGSQSSADARAATQVISDKLRIDSFWAQLRAGFRNLESLRERTLFYARPLMFDKKTRLGLVYEKSERRAKVGISEQTTAQDLPIYLDFAGGSAYRFQSSISLGSKSWRMAPQMRPVAGARSEFKSHLLHGMFLGNINGLSAGSSIYQFAWNSEDARKSPWFDSSFNHLTLLGIDYGRWSLSYGYYFPVFVFGKAGEFREVLGRKASPVGRLAVQRPDWQFEIFWFYTSLSDQNTSIDKADSADKRGDDDLFVRYYSQNLVPLTARLNSSTLRLNFALFPVGSIGAYSDLAITRSNYRETAYRRAQSIDPDLGPLEPNPSGDNVINRFEHSNYAARLGMRIDFGKWVGLGAQVSYEQWQSKGGFKLTANDADSEVSGDDLAYMAMMELLL